MNSLLLSFALICFPPSFPCSGQNSFPKDNHTSRPLKASQLKSDYPSHLGFGQATDSVAIHRDSSWIAKQHSSIFQKKYKIASCTAANGVCYSCNGRGIDAWDRSAKVHISTENSFIPTDKVTSIALDMNDNLWIETLNGGIVVVLEKISNHLN